MTDFINIWKAWKRDVMALFPLNVLILCHIPIISDVAGLCLLCLYPGVLIMRIMSFNPGGIWERVAHAVALSISALMLGGLIINILLPLLNIQHPLETIPVLISLDLVLIIMIGFGNYLNRGRVFINWSSFNLPGLVLNVCFLVLPIVATMGATILNNNGSNMMTGTAICIVVILLFLASLWAGRIRETVLMTGLYCASLGLLLMTSMRSWHVIGFDVNHELQVFRITQSASYWSMGAMQDAYNACLSITILPTIFADFLTISDEYIYKFVFQLIFALLPIIVFYFLRKFVSPIIAFLGVVMLIGQAIFSHAMPALIRQEFGFLYFALVLWVLFTKNLDKRTRYTLACIYGVSIIVSHYSTTYITIMLLGGAVAMNLILSFLKKSWPRYFPGYISHMIPLWFVGFLVAGTIVWGALITGTSNNIVGFIDHSSSNIDQVFSYDTITQAIFQTFAPYPHFEDFQKYLNNQVSAFRAEHKDFGFYGHTALGSDGLVRIPFPQTQGYFGAQVQTATARVFQALKIVVNNLFIILGLLILIYHWWSRKFESSEFLLLAVSGFFALLTFLVLPGALNQYNVDRLYFQLLMIWSLLSVLAGFSVLSFLKKRWRIFILALTYCVVLLFYSSYVFTFTGGSILVSLTNSGADYEKFYAHAGEVYGARWLGDHRGQSLIFSNTPGFNRLQAYGNVDPKFIITTTLPAMIDKDSYVFLTHINTVAHMSTYLFNNEEFAYTVPIEFLNTHKDLIYNNGVAQVYR